MKEEPSIGAEPAPVQPGELTMLRPAPTNPPPLVESPAATGVRSGSSGSWRNWAEGEIHGARIGVGDILRERFVLEESVGEGGMGLVFRARDRRREEARDRYPFVAIKVLGEDFKRHPDSLMALQREARRMQQLSHPNIAAVYDFDRDGPHVYLVMELLEGESLDKALARNAGSGLPPEQARQVIESAGAALRHAHSRGLVHSDFKPGNVFLTNGGEVKVIDFGIARFARSSGPEGESAMTVFDAGELGAWTNAYASPEQMLATAPPDPRDDIYALGLVAYEALAGRHPFGRKSAVEAKFRDMKFEPITGLTQAQNAALAASLQFDREQRLADVMDLVNAFSQSEQPIVATRDGPRRTAAGSTDGDAAPTRRRWRTIALAIAGLAWVGFFAIYWSAQQDTPGEASLSGPAVEPDGAEGLVVDGAAEPVEPPGTVPEAAPVAAAPRPMPAASQVAQPVAADPDVDTKAAPVVQAAQGRPAGPTVASGESDPVGAPASRVDAASAAGSAESPDAVATAPELYRWIDKEGNVQFGENPPEEYAGSAVKVLDL